MANFNVSVTQSIEAQPVNIAAGESTTYVISNPLPASSYFVLETARNNDGFYDSTSPKNTSGSFTLGTGITNLIQSDYIAGVIVQPGGGNLTFVPAVNITNSTLYLRGVGSNEGNVFPPVPPTSSIDPDAAAFFSRVTTAGGTLTPTEQTAVNTLVIQMKADNIWNSMKAVYPMVGASAAACAQNLKSSSFTGSFTSGWTFSSTGITGNASSTFMNTNLNANTHLSRNSTHVSVYLRTNKDALMCDIGGAQTGIEIDIFSKLSNTFFPRCNSGANAGVPNSVSSLNLFITNRISSSQVRAFRNNNLTVLSDSSTGVPNSNIYLGCLGNDILGTKSFFNDRETAFASIGDGLSDTQASNLYTAVQTFQTTLSRQV